MKDKYFHVIGLWVFLFYLLYSQEIVYNEFSLAIALWSIITTSIFIFMIFFMDKLISEFFSNGGIMTFLWLIISTLILMIRTISLNHDLDNVDLMIKITEKGMLIIPAVAMIIYSYYVIKNRKIKTKNKVIQILAYSGIYVLLVSYAYVVLLIYYFRLF